MVKIKSTSESNDLYTYISVSSLVYKLINMFIDENLKWIFKFYLSFPIPVGY